MVRTNVATFQKIFEHSEGAVAVDGSDDEEYPMMADELGLGDDEVIPFPNAPMSCT